MTTQLPLPLLIAVSGKLGTGKDYIVENFLMPLLNGTISKMAFADHVKVNVASQDPNVDLTQCLQGDKSAELRRKLQTAGTENGRDVYGPDIWVMTLENWIRLRRMRDGTPDIVLITDCRFPNEAEWVQRNGGLLLRVIAPERHELKLQSESKGNLDVYDSIKNHESETALDNFKFTYRVNNDPVDLPTVKEQVEHIVRKYWSQHLEYTENFQ